MQCVNPPNIHTHPFFSNPKIRNYQRLEANRVRRLKLSERYARKYDVTRNDPPAPIRPPLDQVRCRGPAMLPQKWDNLFEVRAKYAKPNVLLPFSSMAKNVTGMRFSWDTDNRIRKWELPRGHLMPKWRKMANYDHYT